MTTDATASLSADALRFVVENAPHHTEGWWSTVQAGDLQAVAELQRAGIVETDTVFGPLGHGTQTVWRPSRHVRG